MTTINSVGVDLSGTSGSGSFAGTTSPTFVTPVLGTPTSGALTNCTSIPVSVNMQVFTANGTYTPTTGMKTCLVRVVGGGGGGGGVKNSDTIHVAVGGGGQAGSYAEAMFTAATIGASKAVTIGAAGSSGANTGGNGGNGGTTTFGALISCPGGDGGGGDSNDFVMASINGGFNSTMPTISSAITSIVSPGAAGNPGYGFYSSGAAANAIGGTGGSSPFGGGGRGVASGGSAVAGASGFGAGSGGGGASAAGSSSGALGGAGSSGAVVIIEYIAF